MTEANGLSAGDGARARALRSTKLMPVTTVTNLWLGLGLTLLLLSGIVASWSLYAIRIDQAAVIDVLSAVLPFGLIATAAASLILSIVTRPTRGAEHTISTLSVLVPWLLVASFVGWGALIYAPIAAVLCGIALLFARPKTYGQADDGVESGGYVAPRASPVFIIVFVVGLILLVISAVVYIGWFVQVLVDPAGLTEFFDGRTVDSVRQRDGEHPSALAAAIAGFYGNLLIGGLLFAIGRPRAPKKDVAEVAPKTSLLHNKGFMALAGWVVLNAILSVAVVGILGSGPNSTVQLFYLLHVSVAWLTLCIWFFARIGKNGLLWVGVVVGFITMLMILIAILVLSFLISASSF